MFDVEAINDIDISSISFYPYSSGTITVFTAARTYSGIETDSQSWTQIYTGSATGELKQQSLRSFHIHLKASLFFNKKTLDDSWFKAEFSSVGVISGSTQA
jgi:hypothetical protein